MQFSKHKIVALLYLTLLFQSIALLFLYNKYWNFQWDLTSENRFTMTPVTQNILEKLDEEVYIEVYLAGDLNPTFQYLQNSVRDMLMLFHDASSQKVRYRFINLDEITNTQQKNRIYQSLVKKGLQPTQVFENDKGKRIQKVIFPGAVVSYQGREKSISFLQSKPGSSAQEQIHQSVEGIEYALISNIYALSANTKPRIAFVQGHDELTQTETQELRAFLKDEFTIDYVQLSQTALNRYATLLIAQPKKPFSEYEKFLLDQFIMKGGSAVFLIDAIAVNRDSLSKGTTWALPYQLNLQDLLFRYGVRVNQDLLLDQQAGFLPVFTGYRGNVPQITPLPWAYYIYHYRLSEHLTTRNLGIIYSKFISSIDTVKAVGIQKTPLLFTSQYSRRRAMPSQIGFNEMKRNFNRKDLNESYIPVAYLLEGSFSSLYKGRFAPKGFEKNQIMTQSPNTKIVVISDANIIKNELDYKGKQQPVNFDAVRRQPLSNLEFMQNILSYLTQSDGIISARQKEHSFRPLDKFRMQKEREIWQGFNLIVPIATVIFVGLIWHWYRRRKYT